MRRLRDYFSLSRGACLAGCGVLVLACVVGIASRVQAVSGLPDSGERLITVHDGGHDRGLLTRASTLRQAFKEAGLRIDPNDMVEPGLDEPLVSNNYEVNIYRARPVTIIDGAVRERIMSAYQTGRQIAAQAGITLHDEDTVAMSASTDTITDGTGVRMTIDRATPFSLTLYGKKITAYTQATTVGGMLREKGITLASDDTLSVATDTPITAGMSVELWRNGEQTVTNEESIDYPVKQIQDANQPVGYKRVQTPGVKGTKEVTYEIVMKNGHEVSRHEIQSVVTKKPQEQVEIVGTKLDLPSGSHEDWMRAAGITSSDFGYVNYIVNREGGWEPCKVQGGAIDCLYSGPYGYGMVQATPGGKMASAGDDWRTNPITQLRWATGYAVGRYGSWEAAYNHWQSAHNW